MRKQRFVLDTSAFTGLNRTKEEINKHIMEMIKLISRAKDANITCYTPPSVWSEIKHLLENKGFSQRNINKLDAWLVQKSPSRAELMIPSQFLYEYVGEIRERLNKGLREAEKALIKTKEDKKNYSRVMRELRNKYRASVRQGILDSKEDLDVILLAKELKAGVVASDEGIMKFAKQWGIRFINTEAFPRLLKEYIKKSEEK